MRSSSQTAIFVTQILTLLRFLLPIAESRAESQEPESAIPFSPNMKTDTRDKGSYSLFKPTPTELMREFSSDNGGITNAPYTVDAGHFQFEFEWVNYYKKHTTSTYSSGDSVAIEEQYLALNNLILRMGLTNYLDFEIGYITYINSSSRSGDSSPTVNAGLGDLTLLAKVNFVGNDGGKIAIGMQPFVKFPTNTGGVGNNQIEAGTFIPINLGFSDSMSLTAMPIFYYNKNSNDSGHHLESGYSICFGPQVYGALWAWVEYIGIGSTEAGALWTSQVSIGFEYHFTKNINAVLGTFVGIAGSVPLLNPFLGTTIRL